MNERNSDQCRWMVLAALLCVMAPIASAGTSLADTAAGAKVRDGLRDSIAATFSGPQLYPQPTYCDVVPGPEGFGVDTNPATSALQKALPEVVAAAPASFRKVHHLLSRLASLEIELLEAARKAGHRSPCTVGEAPSGRLELEVRRQRAGWDAIFEQLRRATTLDALNEGAGELASHLLRRQALIVSGGVSLGSYQAGFLEYYLRYLKRRPALLKRIKKDSTGSYPTTFEIITGASAGSSNALLAGLLSCRRTTRDPTLDKPSCTRSMKDPTCEADVQDSLLFKTWIKVGLGNLYREDRVGPSNLFDDDLETGAISQAMAEVQRAWEREDKQWLNGCTFHLGATATRFEAAAVDLNSLGAREPEIGLPVKLPKATEKFLFRFAASDGQAPAPTAFIFEDHLERHSLFPKLLPSSTGAKQDRLQPRDVMQVVKASSTFPVAFKPTELTVTRWEDDEWGPPEVTTYFDGGAFNNNPLDLARELEKEILRKEKLQQEKLQQEIVQKEDIPDDAFTYLFLDQDTTPWTFDAPPKDAKDGNAGIIYEFSPFLSSAPGVAANAQLMSALEANPGLRGRLLVPPRRSPVTGEHQFAMSAFFDRDFRVFDFYRGMADAALYVEQSEEGRLAKHFGIPLTEGLVASSTFDCLRTFDARESAAVAADGSATLPEACRLLPDNLRALILVTSEMKAYAQGMNRARQSGLSMGKVPAPVRTACYTLPDCGVCQARKRTNRETRSCQAIAGLGLEEDACDRCSAPPGSDVCLPSLQASAWEGVFQDQLSRVGGEVRFAGGGQGKRDRYRPFPTCHPEVLTFRAEEGDLGTWSGPELTSRVREQTADILKAFVAKQTNSVHRTLLDTAATAGLSVLYGYHARRHWSLGVAGLGLEAGGALPLAQGQGRALWLRSAVRFAPFATHQVGPETPFLNRSELLLAAGLSLGLPGGPVIPEGLGRWELGVGVAGRAGLVDPGGPRETSIVGVVPEAFLGVTALERLDVQFRFSADGLGWSPAGTYSIPSTLVLAGQPLGSLSAAVLWRIP